MARPSTAIVSGAAVKLTFCSRPCTTCGAIGSETSARICTLSAAPDPSDAGENGSRPAAGADTPASAADVPAIAGEIDYDDLTLAQLRARLQSLSVTDLESLLAYEEARKARAPFQTLLANRITRASAK